MLKRFDVFLAGECTIDVGGEKNGRNISGFLSYDPGYNTNKLTL